MKIIKTNIISPLKFNVIKITKQDEIYKEFHGIRNGLKLDTFEIKNKNGVSHKAKVISNMNDIPIIAKTQTLINNIVKQQNII